MNHEFNTVLVIDQNQDRLKKTCDALANTANVLSATDYESVLEHSQANPIQVVIAHQNFIGTDDLSKIDFSQNGSEKAIKIVIVDEKLQISQALQISDIYRCILTPWQPLDLQMTVKNALNYYKSLDAQKQLTEELQDKNKQLKFQNQNLTIVLDKFEEIQDKLFEMERFSVIGKMASFIIHDLKQPLGIMKNSVDMLSEFELDKNEKKEISEIVTFELSRFTEMLQEILDYAKGKSSFKFQRMPTADVFALIDTDVQRYVTQHKLKYISENAMPDGTVIIDYPRFQRVIMNLIKNAIEAINESKLDREFTIQFKITANENWAEFLIKDNGPGIPPSIRKRLFDPFVSVKRHSGIGLGLAIVKKIVEEHKGAISYHSDDTGTNFIIRLKNHTTLTNV